ncbi:class II aldolase/adducin family protein [Haloplanus rubicundus]|uniref:Fuculose phosphate aldolase n=1 Tax=Haloplanus rubicundus TaxID=1547898 RepID=A0A345ECB2_9EURY|nr:class II aldolase/adducin family protein [Haloplanus rubicundus]AXG09834.1 fuculose phosphate aldolase [Haloplanus rubicundus]
MTDDLLHGAERTAVSDLGRELLAQGLTTGTGGNLSQLCADGETVAISPSGVPYGDVTAADVPLVALDGEQVAGDFDASSETPMHTALYRRRDDIGGVVHTHSPYASTFAALGDPIPASHYLIAFAGDRVPVAGYDRPGSEELAELAAETMGTEYDACLLQNHGTITVGETAEAAFEVALMVEYCARIHYQAISVGEPIILPDEEVDRLRSLFEGYGQR